MTRDIQLVRGDQEQIKAVVAEWYAPTVSEFDEASIVAPWMA